MRIVLAATTIDTNRMNEHPECATAAWLISGIVQESELQQQHEHDFYKCAQAAMKEPEHASAM